MTADIAPAAHAKKTRFVSLDHAYEGGNGVSLTRCMRTQREGHDKCSLWEKNFPREKACCLIFDSPRALNQEFGHALTNEIVKKYKTIRLIPFFSVYETDLDHTLLSESMCV